MSELSRLIRLISIKRWSVNFKFALTGFILLAAANISGAHIPATVCRRYLSQYACGNPIRWINGKV